MEGKPAHLRGLIDTNVEIGVRHGAVLIDLSTALTGRDVPATERSRAELVDALGGMAAVAAVGVVANFQMMNRALDAVGIPARADPVVAAELRVDPTTFGGSHGNT